MNSPRDEATANPPDDGDEPEAGDLLPFEDPEPDEGDGAGIPMTEIWAIDRKECRLALEVVHECVADLNLWVKADDREPGDGGNGWKMPAASEAVARELDRLIVSLSRTARVALKRLRD